MDPWLHLGILADELCKGLELDELRHMLVAEASDGLQGAVIYRSRHAAELLFFRGFGPHLADHYGIPYPCEWTDIPDAGYIGSLAVFHGKTNQGLGLKLITAAHEKIRSAGMPRAYLMVSDFNRRARNFYERIGYQHIGTVADCLRPGNRENLMEITLS